MGIFPKFARCGYNTANHLNPIQMTTNTKELAGVFEEQEFLPKDSETNPTPAMGGEVWYQ